MTVIRRHASFPTRALGSVKCRKFETNQRNSLKAEHRLPARAGQRQVPQIRNKPAQLAQGGASAACARAATCSRPSDPPMDPPHQPPAMPRPSLRSLVGLAAIVAFDRNLASQIPRLVFQLGGVHPNAALSSAQCAARASRCSRRCSWRLRLRPPPSAAAKEQADGQKGQGLRVQYEGE